METDFTSALKQQSENLIFYSESEHAVDVIYLPISTDTEIVPFIAEYVQCNTEEVMEVDVDSFFKKFHNYIGSSDVLMEENAFKFLGLYKYLLENTRKLYVFRVEQPGNAIIPVFIVCESNEGTFAALETAAEET